MPKKWSEIAVTEQLENDIAFLNTFFARMVEKIGEENNTELLGEAVQIYQNFAMLNNEQGRETAIAGLNNDFTAFFAREDVARYTTEILEDNSVQHALGAGRQNVSRAFQNVMTRTGQELGLTLDPDTLRQSLENAQPEDLVQLEDDA